MAGVNLSEESARILATNSELVGTLTRSCKDETFLLPAPLQRRILEIGTCRQGGLCVPVRACWHRDRRSARPPAACPPPGALHQPGGADAGPGACLAALRLRGAVPGGTGQTLRSARPAGKKHGITELHPDVVSYVSHATQQRLQNLVEKISETAQQKNFSYKVRCCLLSAWASRAGAGLASCVSQGTGPCTPVLPGVLS